MTDTAWPTNVYDVVMPRIATLPGVNVTLKRRLYQTDESGAVGIATATWAPTGYEIGQPDPAIARYEFTIQTIVKNTDGEEGSAQHDVLTKSVRSLLYRDADLRLSLAALTETSDGRTEKMLRWGVRAQTFHSGLISGTFTFLSATGFWVDTETT